MSDTLEFSTKSSPDRLNNCEEDFSSCRGGPNGAPDKAAAETSGTVQEEATTDSYYNHQDVRQAIIRSQLQPIKDDRLTIPVTSDRVLRSFSIKTVNPVKYEASQIQEATQLSMRIVRKYKPNILSSAKDRQMVPVSQMKIRAEQVRERRMSAQTRCELPRINDAFDQFKMAARDVTQPLYVQDYMERMGMDIRMQCILCNWAGPKIILEYHIRKEHIDQIDKQEKRDWNITYSLGSLVRQQLWSCRVIEHDAILYFLDILEE
ncbi:hypothetical protein MSG28_012806 [Choristoneura fumiferana]|uniref:Uncharacterized protein n=1 Tax=Choristoneura fumiferana TaxID=7141 RepID=A0ACC0JIV9_CHOFU|nr:hypothetical protein MSG28_012806 [Choristoneura fumiferana]